MKRVDQFFFSESLQNNVSTLPLIIKTSTEPNGGSDSLDDMPTWVALPDLDINSILGSGHESEVDELALDDHVESVYSLEHLPASIRTNKRKRSPHSLSSVHGDTLFGDSPIPSKKIRPSDEHHATPLSAPSLLETTHPTSNVLKNSFGNVRGPMVASSVDSSQNPLPSSSSAFLNNGGTRRTLDIRTAQSREVNNPYLGAEVANIKDAKETDTNCFELDLDDLEIWTQASVASIVFGKAEYSQKLAGGLEVTEACQRMTLRNVKEEMHKKSVASASAEFFPVPPTVTVPYLSLSRRCDQIIEEILGSFSSDTDSSEIGQSVSFLTLQYIFNLTVL